MFNICGLYKVLFCFEHIIYTFYVKRFHVSNGYCALEMYVCIFIITIIIIISSSSSSSSSSSI